MHKSNKKKIVLTLATMAIVGGALSLGSFNESYASSLAANKQVHILPMKITQELNKKLKNAALSDRFPVIVILNKHLNDKEYVNLEKTIGSFHRKHKYTRVIEGFSAELTKKQIEHLNLLSFVSQIDLDAEITLGKDIVITSNFSKDSDHWVGGFADYPQKDTPIYKLKFAYLPLPKEINNQQKGLYLSGMNRSDDLFMFVKKKIDKTSHLKPNTTYRVNFDFDMATNAAKNGMGAGGSPGESVYVKAGLMTQEPKAILDKDNFFHMNIDKGQQSQEGKNALVLGNLAKAKSEDKKYELKNFNNKNRPFIVTTNEQSELWILIGTDSAFESVSSIYIPRTKITLTEM
ncbi:hypothetical protein J2Z69_001208 [Paenibacillus shirakamiensis]|uniref:Uncharacterized protein n=1 Tax=Paenibacillus shirakamiensis TaxID=1265935 RepID=A0ABS4JI23_9BACL|nr:hypothetical protein [Paenibacillus shirakamiensis]MBP2000189.1 hypothetical protein [Paenibacillus shirakamiensis]